MLSPLLLLDPLKLLLHFPFQPSVADRRTDRRTHGHWRRMIWKVAVLLSLVLGTSAVSIGVDDPEDGGKHWVVIVAGSNGWYNYRHQVRN